MKNKSTPLVIEDDAPDIVYAGDGEYRATGGRGDDFIDGGTGSEVEWRLAA